MKERTKTRRRRKIKTETRKRTINYIYIYIYTIRTHSQLIPAVQNLPLYCSITISLAGSLIL